MRSLLHPGSSAAPPKPFWLRGLAALALLLIVVMSTAQVCHSHQALGARAGSSQSAPHPGGTDGTDGSADHCPLCVAMHTALPASLETAPAPAVQLRALDSTAAEAERRFRWRFQLASRPPPAALPRA